MGDCKKEVDNIMTSIRWLFLPSPADAISASIAEIMEGTDAPIPTLSALSLQALVHTNWPLEEFLPGKGYEDQANSLRLLTRDCFGHYEMAGSEVSFVFEDGIEGTNGVKEAMTAGIEKTLTASIEKLVEVTKFANGLWEIGRFLFVGTIPLEGYLRYVFEDEKGKRALQRWIEGRSLVSLRFKEFGVERKVVTFCDDMFIYSRRR